MALLQQRSATSKVYIFTFADKVIIFLTDGEAEDTVNTIVNTIQLENAKLNNVVVILTYGIGSGKS